MGVRGRSITAGEFKTLLGRRNISPLIVFLGEDPFDLDESIRLLCETYVDESSRDFNFQQFSSRDVDIETLLNAARTFPLLADRRLLVLRNIDELSAAAQQSLAVYLDDPVPETILAMTAERLEKKNPFFKRLQERADCVEFQKLRDYQLPELVRKKAAQMGCRFAPDALEFFCHRSGTDLRRLDSEMEKLLEFLGEKKTAELEDVAQASSEGGEAVIFQLTNAVGQRNLSASIVSLQEQLERKTAPLFILIMLVRHFRQLWIVQALHRQGLDSNTIAARAGINRFFITGMLSQAKNYNAEELRRIFEIFLETDHGLKTSGCNPAAVLEDLLCRIIKSLN